jgi:hypothetical protein
MRKQMLVRGLILLIVGGVVMTIGVLTGTRETTLVSENIFSDSHPYGYFGSHEYRTTATLIPGTYELHYNFSSTETIKEFYVIVQDTEGYEIKSVYGPPAVYQNQSAKLTFETQRSGQHTFIFGGEWTSIQVNITKLTQVTRTVYPYEIVLYPSLLLITVGFVLSIFGVSVKEKRKPLFFDNRLSNSSIKPRQLPYSLPMT